MEKTNRLPRIGEIGMEVPVCEAEDDRDLVLFQDDAVEHESVFLVQDRENEGSEAAFAPGATNEVGRLVADQRWSQNVDGLDPLVLEDFCQTSSNRFGGSLGRRGEVLEGGAEAGVLEDLEHQRGIHSAHRVHARAGHLPTTEGKGHVASQIVEVRIDADVGEDEASEGIEEGLCELEVVGAENRHRVGVLDGGPEDLLFDPIPELLPECGKRILHAARVEAETAHGVAAKAVPIAAFEAVDAAPGDGAKALVELLEAPMDDVGPACGRSAAAHTRILAAAAPTIASPKPQAPSPKPPTVDRHRPINKIYRTVGKYDSSPTHDPLTARSCEQEDGDPARGGGDLLLEGVSRYLDE